MMSVPTQQFTGSTDYICVSVKQVQLEGRGRMREGKKEEERESPGGEGGGEREEGRKKEGRQSLGKKN
jgi:hypothetical protein